MRGISKTAKSILAASVVALVALGVGCGDSTRNDQGISFTFLGWFTIVDDEIVGVSTAAMSLSGSGSSNASEGPFPAFSQTLSLMAGLKNNLTQQFVRVDRVFHEYYIPGAALNVPGTSSAIPSTILPGSDGLPPSSTLPDSLDPDVGDVEEATDDAVGNIVFSTTDLVPASVREFMVLNQNRLPEPPFILVVSSYASGVTSAGHRIDSNLVEFEVLVEPDVLITPTPGSGEGGEDTEEESLAAAEIFE